MSGAASASTASVAVCRRVPAGQFSSAAARRAARASRRKRAYAVPVKRANRLSRSRDFDAVYRRGRSVSSRFLVLYWFPQEEPADPRFGFSVPRAVGGAVERNRIKRQLREVWQARLEAVSQGNDYVLIVRPGLPEAVAANGFEWLGERVDEVLSQSQAAA